MNEQHGAAQLKRILRENMSALSYRYEVKSLALFGSYAREGQHATSDLDLLVTFETSPSLLRFIELENYLSDLLGVKVDLVMPETLKPRIGQHILNEMVPVRRRAPCLE